MQLGIIGLGRMGGNIARRLIRKNYQTVVYDQNPQVVARLVADGGVGTASLEALVSQLSRPRVIWVMLPAGEATEATVIALAKVLELDDVVIDGGNSFYKDDIRRAKLLLDKGVRYVDVGTSGGIWGLDRGFCMMIGGEREVFERLDPLFDALAPGYGSLERTKGRISHDDRAERGYIHAGPVGAGHFVKMIHNGIEYGLMQAYAEGFDILKMKAAGNLPVDERFDLNLVDIAEVWRRGSVISSWLLDLTAMALAGDAELGNYTGAVADSGEGRWTIDAAIEQGVPVPVLAAALFTRFRSQSEHTFAERLLSAMRFGFGGHIKPP